MQHGNMAHVTALRIHVRNSSAVVGERLKVFPVRIPEEPAWRPVFNRLGIPLGIMEQMGDEKIQAADAEPREAIAILFRRDHIAAAPHGLGSDSRSPGHMRSAADLLRFECVDIPRESVTEFLIVRERAVEAADSLEIIALSFIRIQVLFGMTGHPDIVLFTPGSILVEPRLIIPLGNLI